MVKAVPGVGHLTVKADISGSLKRPRYHAGANRHIMTDIYQPGYVNRHINVGILVSSLMCRGSSRKKNPAYPCRVTEMRHLMSDGGQRCCPIPSGTGASGTEAPDTGACRRSEVTGHHLIADSGISGDRLRGRGMGRPCLVSARGYFLAVP